MICQSRTGKRPSVMVSVPYSSGLGHSHCSPGLPNGTWHMPPILEHNRTVHRPVAYCGRHKRAGYQPNHARKRHLAAFCVPQAQYGGCGSFDLSSHQPLTALAGHFCWIGCPVQIKRMTTPRPAADEVVDAQRSHRWFSTKSFKAFFTEEVIPNPREGSVRYRSKSSREISSGGVTARRSMNLFTGSVIALSL